jgi:hypothetical protein
MPSVQFATAIVRGCRTGGEKFTFASHLEAAVYLTRDAQSDCGRIAHVCLRCITPDISEEVSAKEVLSFIV